MENTITIPSGLEGFTNTNTKKAPTVTDRMILIIDGKIREREDDRVCPKCGCKMHVPVSYTHLTLPTTAGV